MSLVGATGFKPAVGTSAGFQEEFDSLTFHPQLDLVTKLCN